MRNSVIFFKKNYGGGPGGIIHLAGVGGGGLGAELPRF